MPFSPLNHITASVLNSFAPTTVVKNAQFELMKMAADLCAYKLALVASFKINILLIFELKNEARRANLNTNKRMLRW